MSWERIAEIAVAILLAEAVSETVRWMLRRRQEAA